MATTRTALVTGGASGLGAAAAKRLRAEGLQVTTLDLINADVTADVADEQTLRRVAGQIGPVDVLVNSAGIVGPNKPLLETTVQDWRRVFDVNVLGAVKAQPSVQHRPWPGTERSHCPPESGNVQACWCRLWVSLRPACLGFQRTRSRSRTLIILENYC